MVHVLLMLRKERGGPEGPPCVVQYETTPEWQTPKACAIAHPLD
jgi:hypothetical protein